jgi:hypothetical protein
MSPISKVTCGIKPLEVVLNALVAAINRRTIDTGAGLTKSESDSGILITLQTTKPGDGSGGAAGTLSGAWQVTPDNEAAGWHQITVVDDACNRLPMWIWGGTPGGNPGTAANP